MSSMDDWVNKLWYTHESEYHTIIKNDLTDGYEHEKTFKIRESKTAKGSILEMPAFIYQT